MTSLTDEPSEAGALFAVDVDEAIAKLGAGAIDGPWQIPLELIRSCVRFGARRVEIAGRWSWSLRAHGGGLAPSVADQLATLADPLAPSVARERALGPVERALGPGALALLASPGARLELTIRRRGAARTVRIAAPGAVTVGPALGSGPDGLHLRVEGVGALNHSSADQAIHSRARFTGIELRVRGRPVCEGWPDRPVVGSVREPQPAWYTVDPASEVTWVDCLVDGIVKTPLVIPTIPGLRLAVELGRHDDGPRGSEHLRARLSRSIDPLLGAVSSALLGRLDALGPDERKAARRALVATCGRGLNRAVIARAPIFPLGAGARRISLDTLRARAQGPGGLRCATGHRARRRLEGDADLLAVDDDERRWLEAQLGLTLPVAVAPGPGASAAALARWVGDLWGRSHRGRALADHPGAARLREVWAGQVEPGVELGGLRVVDDAKTWTRDGPAPVIGARHRWLAAFDASAPDTRAATAAAAWLALDGDPDALTSQAYHGLIAALERSALGNDRSTAAAPVSYGARSPAPKPGPE